jgi:hypothetical protein
MLSQRMIRKISILALAFVFFGATTGMPVALHICKIMGTTSSAACKMYEAKVIKHSCCKDEQSDNPVKVTSANLPCCQTELVYNKVKDDFLFVKTETTNVLVFSSLFVETINQQSSLSNLNANPFYTDTSPPLNSNHIYLNISQLLI